MGGVRPQMSRSHHDQRTMCSGSQKICTESGKSVLAEQVSNTPNRSNHCATRGKAHVRIKVSGENSLKIRWLVKYQYVADCVFYNHKVEDGWVQIGLTSVPILTTGLLSIIPVILALCQHSCVEYTRMRSN